MYLCIYLNQCACDAAASNIFIASAPDHIFAYDNKLNLTSDILFLQTVQKFSPAGFLCQMWCRQLNLNIIFNWKMSSSGSREDLSWTEDKWLCK